MSWPALRTAGSARTARSGSSAGLAGGGRGGGGGGGRGGGAGGGGRLARRRGIELAFARAVRERQVPGAPRRDGDGESRESRFRSQRHQRRVPHLGHERRDLRGIVDHAR